jgi:hypothetical protein
MTAQQYIISALRKCGQLRPGYTPNSDFLGDGLNEFQFMFDSMNAKRTENFTIPDYIYPVSGNTGINGIYGQNVQFTVGPSFTFQGTLNGTTLVAVANTVGLVIGMPISGTNIPANTRITAISQGVSITMNNAATGSGAVTITVTPSFAGPRPEAIVRMNLYMTSVSPTQPTRLPLAPISAEEWANISVIQITPINVTTVFYYDPQFPQGVINVWPPLNGNSLEFFTWGFLTPPTTLATTVNLPPGYSDVIVYELAKRLWPMCTLDILPHKVTHQWLCGQAAIAKQRIRDANAPMPRMGNDFGPGAPHSPECDWSLLLTGIPY